MGNCGSGGSTSEQKEERERNKEIEAQLAKDRKEFERELKLLLLGKI